MASSELFPGHIPVLLDRVVTLLAPALERPGSVLVDATLGLGGHTAAILERCPGAHVVGIDRDEQALALAGRRLAPFGAKFTAVHAVYDGIAEVVADLGRSCVEAVLFDLGVSSLQLDASRRGFSYSVDAPLDMRMDQTSGPTAADVLQTYSEASLARLLRVYGEERFAARIAAAVVRERSVRPLRTSAQLVGLVREAIPAPARRRGGHPAKRTFQALRIEVNEELAVLRRALPPAIRSTCVGGRLVVLAYHSLEDRIVKRELTRRSRDSAPPDLPVVPAAARPELVSLTRGAEQAGADEIEVNPRARSVRLRAAERVRAAA